MPNEALINNDPIVAQNFFLEIDGSVVSILPFTGTRGIESKPTVSAEGTTRVFRGNFLAAYDKDGKNLAPNGASTVKVDASGKIIAE